MKSFRSRVTAAASAKSIAALHSSLNLGLGASGFRNRVFTEFFDCEEVSGKKPGFWEYGRSKLGKK
ncbi:MAG: hypothetical protein HC941_19240 [Microcoleus sp. SU_5_3]|nr:hypothetical protein [Microcoleus sp. SU_5_3]